MIFFLCDGFHRYTLDAIRRSPARRARISVKPYSWLFAREVLPGGTYVFTDHERLAEHELAAAAEAFHSLREAGTKVLNDPAKVRVRAELLHELYRTGANPFAAHRAGLKPKPQRFPVFLRNETDHALFSEALIDNQESLDLRLEQLESDGVPLKHLLVVEFSAAPSRPGIYRRHSVLRIGETFLATSPVAEERWAVKYGKPGLSTDEELAASVAEMDGNPYGERLRQAFEAARIDYGRADFGLIGDRLSVFEINTNPAFGVLGEHRHRGYKEACDRVFASLVKAIDALDTESGPVRIAWRRRRSARLRHYFGLILARH